MKSVPRLYAIADASFGDPVGLSRALFAGGARLVQIRNKTAGAAELLAQVEDVMRFAPPDAQVVVNDRVDVALLAKAGVHLGQDDFPVLEARSILGDSAILGISTHNLDQALRANELPVDYIAVGPIYATTTKSNPDPVVGVEQLAEICRKVTKPVVAIGGLTLDRAERVFAAGARSLAVIRDLSASEDIAGRTRQWIEVCH
jgi:thiamine-phosphate pyrophosphorylase